jgi:hypothetical protein
VLPVVCGSGSKYLTRPLSKDRSVVSLESLQNNKLDK